MQPLSLGYLS